MTLLTETLETRNPGSLSRTQLIVLGMHRSGTSALTGVMEALGAYVGDKEELTATSWENPKGFFERQDLRALCDAFLHSADADWWKIADFDQHNISQATREKLAPKLAELVNRLDSRGTWAIKEPRLCLLLPLFEKYLSAPAVIFISRNPLEVAKSLRRRNGFPIDAGLALWEAYNIAALRHSAHFPRIFLNYHDLIANPAATVLELGKRLEELGVAGLNQAQPDEVIEESLHREQASDKEFSERLTPAQKRLWEALASGNMRDLPLEISYNSRCILHEFADDTNRLHGLQAEIHEQIELNKRRQHEFARSMEKKAADLEALAQKAGRRARELQEVYNSTSWKITVPLRTLSRNAPKLAAYGRKGLRAGKRLATIQIREALRRRFTLRHRERMFTEVSRLFDHDWYKAQEVADKKLAVQMLLNCLREGVRQREADRTIQRQYKDWSTAREEAFLKDVDALYAKQAAHFDAIKAAVIMPTWDRGSSIGEAINSVLGQTHGNFTLYVIDDGSADNTHDVVEAYAARDARVQYHRLERGGVSKARNYGLQLANEAAEAAYVFYLDSDNSWFGSYLRTMIVFMETGKLDAGYAGIEAKNDGGDTDFFRGDEFDWQACHQANYVDLNCFAHRRDAVPESQDWFDNSLRRMVDWDFILRLTALRRICFAPFLAVHYYNGDCGSRITKTEHLGDVKDLRMQVQAKHDPAWFSLFSASENRPNWGEIRWAQTAQHIGLKIPAPYDKRMEWGDYHYAESLKAAFEAQGHTVIIDFAGDWDKRPAAQDDMVIVLRGLNRYEPKPEHFNIMWNISHPDQVAYEEYEEYDLVCVASVSYAAFLRTVIRKPVACLLQSTDTSRFYPTDKNPSVAADVLFVGNSRNEYRDIVRWAVDADSDLSVYGTRWEGFIDSKLVKGENINNTKLGSYYCSANAVLNDHWASMRDYGLVSNRIFDVLAAGGTLISDKCHSSGYLFGEAVQQVSNSEEFETALKEVHRRDEVQKLKVADYVAKKHSFYARSQSLLHHTYRALSNHVPDIADDAFMAMPFVLKNAPLKVNVICTRGHHGPQSSAYIRLISPLTHDSLVGKVEMQLVWGEDIERAAQCDVAIVQRVAIDSPRKAQFFVEKCAERGAKIIVDNDDAFTRIDPAHPEFAAYTQKNLVMEQLMQQASQLWFSTAELAEAYGHIDVPSYVVENALDARIWRNYRQERPLIGQRKVVQIVYMGTSTHDADFEMILPALDALAKEKPNSFELTLISAVRNPPRRSWIKLLNTEENARVYPRFVRWFVKQPHWDVGLSPLTDNPFNRCKSDIKFLDYAALGILPVLSDMAAYNGDAKELGLAIMAENGSDSWFTALCEAVETIKEHRETVRKAGEYVWSRRSGEQMAARQWSLLNTL